MINIYDYERKVYSQRGEDGMIEHILRVLGIQAGWCCEFGAWDGVLMSNVYKLITEGWGAVLIEGNNEKFPQLVQNMKRYPGVNCHQSYVSLEPGENLNDILYKYYPEGSEDFGVLSIDIDSYDYWVWADLEYNPAVVVIEYNSNWEDDVTCPYDVNHHGWAGNSYFGASASALQGLGNHKGYDLIGFMPYTNLFFVKKELNNGKFKLLDLLDGKHIQSPHHGPLTPEQESLLVYNPALKWKKE